MVLMIKPHLFAGFAFTCHIGGTSGVITDEHDRQTRCVSNFGDIFGTSFFHLRADLDSYFFSRQYQHRHSLLIFPISSWVIPKFDDSVYSPLPLTYDRFSKSMVYGMIAYHC